MIVAVVCDVLGEANNGTTIASLNLIQALKERGHEVRVICPDPSHEGEEGWYIVPRFRFGPFQGYVERNGVAPAKLDRRVLELAIMDADIIHVMLPFALGKAAARYAHRYGIPLTAGFHCQAENITGHIYLSNRPFVNRLVYRILYERLYQYCDCIHYPTRFICDTFQEVVGLTPHRIISNGVNRAFCPAPEEAPGKAAGTGEEAATYTVLYTGRYSPEKCHDVLIDAVALSRHREQIRLIFAGTGPLKDKLAKQAARRGLPRPIMHFYGREELIRVIRQADLYVHPARIEIEAIACLEAIACGKVPLIANSRRSATRYFALSRKNLFRSGDARDLAKKMDWWLEHPRQREACARRYLGYARQFDFDHCMEEMEQMLTETVEHKRHAH